jgi:hypothetical protein
MDAMTQKVLGLVQQGNSLLWGGVYLGPTQDGRFFVLSLSDGEEVFPSAEQAVSRAARQAILDRIARAFATKKR